MKLGYFLSCEEFSPRQLIEQAQLAEEAGFEALWISDHFHPWNDEQGESPFVWSVIGALSQVCSLPVTTAVTCPIMRIQPTVIAQAAASAAVMCPGGFRLGVGTGEALNEHIHGQAWPSAEVRLDMLEEAVLVMRELWTGEVVNYRGRYFTVDNARIYTMAEPPEVYVSGFGEKATELAARIGDGYVSTRPDADLVSLFKHGSGDKPAAAGFKVAFAPDEDQAAALAHRLWASSGLPGELSQVLPTPRHFEQASKLVTNEMIRDKMVCGPDVERHISAFDEYVGAGFDEIYVANIGPDYEEMIRVYGREVLPAVRDRAGLVGARR